VVLVLGLRASSDASNARESAAALSKTRRQLALRASRAANARQSLITTAGKVTPALDALDQALDDASAAQRHLVDVDDHGVDQFNAGDESGSVATFTGDGAAALADLTQKTTAVHGALTSVQQTVQAMQEALDGSHG
jgi:hypothetical protein